MRSMIVCFIIFASGSEGLRCFQCTNAPTDNECEQRGRIKECRGRYDVCKTEIRVGSFRNAQLISKGCKQGLACKNDELGSNCSMEPNSLCSCCCNRDECNRDALTCVTEKKASGRDSFKRCPPLRTRRGRVTCTSGTEPESDCSVTCDNGYVVDTEKSSVKCLDTGVWSGIPPKCIVGKCWPRLNFVTNGYATCSRSNFLNSECRFSCRRSHELVGRYSSRCSIRRGRPSWSNMKPTCRKRNRLQRCLPFPKLSNGEVTCSNLSPALRSTCRFDCAEGYVLKGRKWVTCVVGSSGRAQWTSKRNQVCVPEGPPAEVCNVIKKFSHGIVTCDDNRRINSDCVYRCHNNFRLVGPKRVTCVRKNGEVGWSDKTPICQPQCPPLVELESGFSECATHLDIGTSCSFTCKDDFALIGAYRINCSYSDGAAKWSGKQPICKKVCNKVGNLNGGATKCTYPNTASSRCFFSCSAGFQLVGAKTLTCIELRNKEVDWDNKKPTCKKICPDPQNEGGQVLSCSNGRFVDSVCKVTCPGSSRTRRITCAGGATTSWEGNVFDCKEIRCPTLEEAQGGTWNCSNGFFTGSVCDLLCVPNCNPFPRTSPSITCQPDGKWDHHPPSCFSTCPPDPMVDLLFVVVSISSGNNWIQVVQFVQHFSRFYTDVSNGTFISVTTLQSNRVDFVPLRWSRSRGVRNAVERIGNISKLENGNRKARSAISLHELFSSENGARPNASNVVVVIVDGYSPGLKDKLAKWEEDYQVYVVEVGMTENTSFKTKPGACISVEGYDGLTSKLAKQFVGVICDDPTCHGEI